MLCDVVPMQASHVLLGRPWEFYLDATYASRSNKYSFVKNGRHHSLISLSSSAVMKFSIQDREKRQE